MKTIDTVRDIVTKGDTADTGQVSAAGERYENLFGKTRNRPTPLSTLGHLAPADLGFVVMADLHIINPGEKRLSCHNWRAEEAIRQVNALQPEFVIELGDLFTGMAWWSEESYERLAHFALGLVARLDGPVYHVPGTHDCGVQHPHPVPDMVCTPETCDRYRKLIGDNYYSFEAQGCRFIVINNQLCNSGYPEEEAQRGWLEDELQKPSSAQRTFALMHVPPFWRAPDEEGGEGNFNTLLQPGRSWLLELLSRHRVDVVYSGHIEFGFANEWHGIHLRTLNSTTRTRDFLSTLGTPKPMSGLARFYDPYKVGFLVVRVRDGEIHESWVPTYWRVGDPPVGLAELCGPRLVARPATEVEDSVLGITAAPPTPVSWEAPEGFWEGRRRDCINDHWWRLAEDIGSKWLQVWPMPYREADWVDLERGLTLGRPRGVKIAVPVPADSAGMEAAWARLQPYAEAIAAVVVCNGGPSLRPTDVNPRLTTWMAKGSPEGWGQACAQARELAPKSTQVVLARLPLLGDGATARIKETAAALEGRADGLAVWVMTQAAPEEIWNEIASAAELARSHGLELWLDVVAWEQVKEPLRSAYFLRLLALCQAERVRLFWWNGPYDEAGLLDGYFDPTWLYYAAQAWQAMVDGPPRPIDRLREGETVQLRWRDSQGREYVVWWRSLDDLSVGLSGEGFSLPSEALVADPLHGRLLDLSSSGTQPLCAWPLVARTGSST